MTIKEIIQHAYDDLVSLKVNWFNGIMLALIVLVVNSITTPFIGVPVGLLGGGYILKRYEKTNIRIKKRSSKWIELLFYYSILYASKITFNNFLI